MSTKVKLVFLRAGSGTVNAEEVATMTAILPKISLPCVGDFIGLGENGNGKFLIVKREFILSSNALSEVILSVTLER